MSLQRKCEDTWWEVNDFFFEKEAAFQSKEVAKVSQDVKRELCSLKKLTPKSACWRVWDLKNEYALLCEELEQFRA